VNLLFYSLRQLNIKQEKMKRKLDKKRKRQFENLLFFLLRQFNALQIKPYVLIVSLKCYLNIHFHTFVLKNMDTCRLYIYIYIYIKRKQEKIKRKREITLKHLGSAAGFF
jgi:hypothetical protein